MLIFYKILTFFLYPILILLIFLRKLQKKEDHIRYKEKIFTSKFKPIKKVNKLYWFHASSIGEFKSVISLIRNFIEIHKNCEILITSSTVSSSKVFEDEVKERNIYHRFFPVDTSYLIKNFLDSWNPDGVFLVDSEIWPNLIFEINKKKIPLILINGRITLKTFNRWKMFPKFSKSLFEKFNVCISSDKKSVRRLINLGAKKVSHFGNLKFTSQSFDLKIDHNTNLLKDNFIWCASSIHMGEEKILLKAQKLIKEKYPNIKLIIIPRHINNSKKIFAISQAMKFKTQIIDEYNHIDISNEIIIVNKFGKISKYFQLSSSVFLGKSLLKKYLFSGGQNPLEAAAVGCKVLYGPYISNFDDIYEFLKLNKMASEIGNETDLFEQVVANVNLNKNFKLKNINLIKERGASILDNTLACINQNI